MLYIKDHVTRDTLCFDLLVKGPTVDKERRVICKKILCLR